ncbi:uncharacterized protein LOC109821366 [Asparagus officinalis]|uniref:uncharacterized protein LOC109821366 n=1 Tax=Asparagus officinalis TaxID=4686 RepID=UPI00098E8513|nr:uncharacterized protein LOC109821366 [Asparagus officinalis]
MHSLKDKGKAIDNSSPGAQGIKHGSPCLTNVYQSTIVNASGFTSVSRAHIARRTTINIAGNSNQKTQFSPLDPQYNIPFIALLETKLKEEKMEFIYQYNIPFIALLETKLKEEKMEHIARKFARDWNWISNVQEAVSCLMSVVYASNQRENRKRLWQDLLEIKQNVNCPWLVGGDFNAIISAEEKMGGAPISDADTEDFQNFISSSQLLHIKSIGCFYTWNNKQDANTRVWSRIDRILINDRWLHHYTSSQVEFLVPMCSDHSPALVSVGEEDFQGKKPFKFYKMWTKHPNFLALVNSVWGQEIKGYNMYKFYSKLKMLKPVLKELNKKHFMNIGEQVARAKEELLGVQNQMSLDLLNQNLITQEKKCIQKYNRLLQCEESFHRQKANISRAVHGDRSSQYFHSIMKAKRHQNRVLTLYSENERRITDLPEIATEFIEYYRNMLGKKMNTLEPDPAVISDGPILMDRHRNELESPITNEKIKHAVFTISDEKAPGPDGYIASFFKSTWNIISAYMIKAVQEFFSSGRIISNNILLAHELVKHYGRKHISPRATLNIDLRKAFDTISWDFIKAMLTGLGFPGKMIGWIMTCITTTKFSLSLNGSLHGYFKGARGLRQGDPLSLYLFVIGMEYLSRRMKKLRTDNLFKYHPRCSGLGITHLIFADDLPLFSKADIQSISKLNSCLQDFSRVSGLEANSNKCAVYLGGVEDNVRNQICSLLSFSEGSLPIRYLGMPLISKRLLHLDCSSLISKILEQIQGWQSRRKMLYAGRIQLIKTVIMGIQNYWTISWRDVCTDRKMGGLGLYSAKTWSYAAAMKLLWMIHTKKDILWIKWVHENYIHQVDIWQIQARRTDSWMWRQLLKVRDLALNKFGDSNNLQRVMKECYDNGKIQISEIYKALTHSTTPNDTMSDSIWGGCTTLNTQ